MRNRFRSERKSFNLRFMYRKPLTIDGTLGRLEVTDLATRLARIVIAEDKKRTYDMGGKASTLDVARAAKIPRSTWPKPSPITLLIKAAQRRNHARTLGRDCTTSAFVRR